MGRTTHTLKAAMRVVASIADVQKALSAARKKAKKIGFVPTMGALHEGHGSLMRAARRTCDYVVVSIFVNPLQFGPNDDFKRYPRTLAQDKKMASEWGVDLLWTPRPSQLVPPQLETYISVRSLADCWEGIQRPGHFQGVATIVAKLFQIIKPDMAYFGQKDYQQTAIIRQMARDLHFDTIIRIMPTVREKDGLALSSRNRLLTPDERQAAPILYHALSHVKKMAERGEKNCRLLKKSVESLFAEEPRAQMDYIAFCDPERLTPVSKIGAKTVALIAARIGSVRLIDCLMLETAKQKR